MAADNTTTSLVWLPQTKAVKRKARSEQDQGWFQLLKKMPDNEFYMWKLIDSSLPPLLARKYHIVNVTELMKDGEDRRYMGVATWFVIWSQAFGLQHLNSLHLQYDDLKRLQASKRSCKSMLQCLQITHEQEKWREEASETVRLMNEARTVETAPTLKDNATTASGFLLEPCVIVQLPWNNVLFHQWLAAALVEVLVFEKSSLELRHWPLPPELEPPARELLTVVRQLKERLVLGFAIMSQQVVSHPKVEESHPGWIMDEVVLPSLATLQFLTTGKAYTILKSIKKLAWSNHDHVARRMYIDNTAYCMDDFLNKMFSNLCYNFPFFYAKTEPSYPILVCDCLQVDIEKVIKRIQYNNNDIASIMWEFKIPFDRKAISVEEESILGYLKLKQASSKSKHLTTVSERINLTLQTIKELLVDSGRIPFAVFSSCEDFFKTCADLENLQKSVFSTECSANSESMVKQAMIYWEVHGYLVDSEKEQNVFARTVFLQLEIVEREQIIRLANITTSMEDITPVAIKLDKSPPMTIQSMTQTLEEVRKKREGHTRDWLWTQFPVEWRKPVNVKGPALQLSLGTSVIVKLCEERIGRMVFNVARSSFGVFEKGGEVFPHWQTVQYILPCFVASFVELMKQPDEIASNFSNKSNMLKYVNGILKFYEVKCQNWLKNIKVRQVVKPVKQDLKCEPKDFEAELVCCCSYYKDRVALMIATLIEAPHNDTETEGVYGWDHMKTSLIIWPATTVSGKKNSSVQKNCKIWLEMCLQFMKDLDQIIMTTWNIPSKIKQLRKQIHEVYVAEAIINVLITVANINYHYVSDDSNQSMPSEFTSINTALLLVSIQNKPGTFDLISNIVNSDSISAAEIAESAEASQATSIGLYKLLKKCRQLGPSVICKIALEHLPIEPPELKIAAQHYINGNFIALDKLLKVLIDPNEKPLPKSEPPNSSSEKPSGKSVPKKVRPKKVEAEGPFEQCRNCPRTERKWGPFLRCEKCVEQKYPDVNFFCSKKCQQERWAAEHMAEHLEFELGLADFSHLTLK